MSYSQEDIWEGLRTSDSLDVVMSPAEDLVEDPCPFGLHEMLTGAHTILRWSPTSILTTLDIGGSSDDPGLLLIPSPEY